MPVLQGLICQEHGSTSSINQQNKHYINTLGIYHLCIK
jgi:hypothetical protein